MKTIPFTNGPFMVNSYLLYDDVGVIIDPGHDGSEIIECITERKIEIKAVILTHGHIDHVAGVNYARNAFDGIKVYMNHNDIDLINNLKFQAKMFSLPAPPEVVVDEFIKDNETLNFGNLSIKCLYTPGHSDGSMSFVCGNQVFSGDILFRESVGRTDLFGGNHSVLLNSIREKIFSLPDSFTVYPGHGPETSVSHEKEFNMYLK